jgi:protocatechuate 3,4-dioxygenase beta subunit
MSKVLHRRELLAVLSAGFGAALAGCGSSSPTSPSTSASTTTTTGTTSTSCAVTPSETEGPYPDKTRMINNSAFFRRDITEGRSGLPLTLTLTIVSVSGGCSPVSNASVEIWQCDASGNYSEYSQPGFDGTGQTFLRGIQVTDASGQVTFTTIYPGWYAGRATHIHVDVFRSGSLAKTTQIAFPESDGRGLRVGRLRAEGPELDDQRRRHGLLRRHAERVGDAHRQHGERLYRDADHRRLTGRPR